jgi:hypothetical protein
MNPKPLSLTSRLIVPFIGAAIAVSQRKRVDMRVRVGRERLSWKPHAYPKIGQRWEY